MYNYSHISGNFKGCCEFLKHNIEGQLVVETFKTSLTLEDITKFISDIEEFINIKFEYLPLSEDSQRSFNRNLEDLFPRVKGDVFRVSFTSLKGKQTLAVHTWLRYLWACPQLVTHYLEFRKDFGIYASLILAHSFSKQHTSYKLFCHPILGEAVNAIEFKERWKALGEGVLRFECSRCGCIHLTKGRVYMPITLEPPNNKMCGQCGSTNFKWIPEKTGWYINYTFAKGESIKIKLVDLTQLIKDSKTKEVLDFYNYQGEIKVED